MICEKANISCVSVVVPVYNVVETLDACVESLVKQTLANIEIVLVDDGSPDECPEICDEWARRDSRILVVHKENGGLSDARNAGIRVASSPYIGFVDSDDTVEPEMFETLYGNMIRERADLSLCGVANHYPGKTVFTKPHDLRVTTGKEAFRLALAGEIPGIWAVARLYPKKLFETVRFPVGMNYEDAYITADVYINSPKVVIDSRPMYHYWHKEGSITGGTVSRKALDQVTSFDYMTSVAETVFPDMEQLCRFRRLWARFDVLDRLASARRPLSDEQRSIEDELVRFLREKWKDVVLNPFFSKGRKASMLLLLASRRFYYVAVRKRDMQYE